MLRDAALLTEGNLYDIFNVSLIHHVQQSLRAHTLFARDVDYIVRDDKVVIIDEFTGRMMEGRRYSEGLHQALEAKEHVTVERRTRRWLRSPSRTISGCIPKLAGMTGTAMTEADEFARDLQAAGGGDTDQRAGDAAGPGRRGVPHRHRKIRGRGDA